MNRSVVMRACLGVFLVGWLPACSLPGVESAELETPPERAPVDAAESPSRLSAEVLPPQVDDIPERTPPLLEFGDPFYGSGPIRPGWTIPTGAVLQPSFQVFGTFRTALQGFAAGNTTTTEWANRLDLFGNLQLSGTERILIGFRPLDEEGSFAGYVIEASRDEGWNEEFDLEPSTLFFEGDLGEIFPALDERDTRSTDLGISVGRQPLLFQEGLLIDDTIDAVGITRNTLHPPGFSNLRLTALFGGNDVHRDDNLEDDSALLFGLFAEADVADSTLTLDTVWIHDRSNRTDALYVGAGAVRTIGRYDAALRCVGSFPTKGDSPEVSAGGVVLGEISRTLAPDDALVYANAFVGIDEFSSAARGPASGGPLGRVGLLYSAVGLGNFGSALDNRPDDAIGGAVGYQGFLDADHRQQWVVELGARTDTNNTDRSAVAAGVRYERAFGRRWILRVDGFVAARDELDPAGGLRTELLLKL